MSLERYVDRQPMVPMAITAIGLTGLAVGVMTWLVMLGLSQFVLTPIFCRSTDTSYCMQVPTISFWIATVAGQLVGLLGLIKLGVFRPLLVVLASIITLIGVHIWIAAFPWWEAALYTGGLFALVYALYAWINRLSSFPVALAVTVAVIVLGRLAIISF